MFVSAYPFIMSLSSGNTSLILAMSLLFGALIGMTEGTLNPLVASSFPTNIRATSVAFCWNFTSVAFGGVPLISLVRQAGGGEAWSVGRLALEWRRAVNLQLPMMLDTLLVSSNADTVLGKRAVVIVAIEEGPGQRGQVRVGTEHWSARSEDERPIPEGVTVAVSRIDGVALVVRPVG